MENLDNGTKNRIKQSLGLIGFSETETENQLKKINQIISQSLLNKIVEENPKDGDKIIDDPEKYLTARYSTDQLNKIMRDEGTKILEPYFNEITKGLDVEKKKVFFNSLYQ